ncbi:hypothetical protein [Streptomyces sp. NPDC087270]|uniref:hypothetical protein n=1 Tax=Streptomyces sp. NPDC087270 TaxID=3365774 RepID=UPI0037FB1878
MSEELARTVLSLVPADDPCAYTREDVFATLVCTIEAHGGPVHYGAALNLRGPDAGTVWALWREGETARAAIEIPDCPAVRAEDDDACSEFAGHPGGHSWTLGDPPQPAEPFPLPRPLPL